MSFFYIARIVTFGLSVLFSIIVLGLSAHLIALTEQFFNLYFNFCALGIATAVLTIFTVPAMLFVDIMRTGAFTSMILVELIWLFILWVLWVATAGQAVDAANLFFPAGCVYSLSSTNQACHEVQAIEAFSFLAFFTLLGYTIVLLVFSSIAAVRGNSVWFSSVKESRFLAPAAQMQSQPVSMPTPMQQFQPQTPQQFQQPQTPMPSYQSQPGTVPVQPAADGPPAHASQPYGIPV